MIVSFTRNPQGAQDLVNTMIVARESFAIAEFIRHKKKAPNERFGAFIQTTRSVFADSKIPLNFTLDARTDPFHEGFVLDQAFRIELVIQAFEILA